MCWRHKDKLISDKHNQLLDLHEKIKNILVGFKTAKNGLSKYVGWCSLLKNSFFDLEQLKNINLKCVFFCMQVQTIFAYVTSYNCLKKKTSSMSQSATKCPNINVAAYFGCNNCFYLSL